MLLEYVGLLNEVLEMYDEGKFGLLLGRISGLLGSGLSLIFGFKMMGFCFLNVCFFFKGFGFCCL